MSTADQRWEREQVLADICEELHLEHTTSCYVEQVGDASRETFWVCMPGCPTRRAFSIAKRRKLLVQGF